MFGVKHLQQMNDQVYSHAQGSRQNSGQKQIASSKQPFTQTPSPKNDLNQSNNYLGTQSPQMNESRSTSGMIKNSIRIVFMFYSSFGDRQNTTYLKSNKFIKLLSDAQIIPDQIGVSNADILYHQQTKHTQTLTLSQFQQILPALALLVYPQVRVHQGVLKLYQNHFQQLFDKIMSFTEFGEQMVAINPNIDGHFAEIIQPLTRLLNKIHTHVFYDQSLKLAKVQWQYLQFLTQFELLPAIINQSQAQLLFTDLTTRPPKISLHIIEPPGKFIFSLNAFIESLIIISLIQMKQNSFEDEFQSFKFMLERMETSPGFVQFQKGQSRTQSDQSKLVATVDRISYSGQKSNSRMQQSQVKSTTDRKYEVREFLEVDEEILHFIQPLRTIFEHYASLGEPLNVQYLKGFKFNKLLLHANILNDLISPTDCNMIYAKLTGQGFIQSVKSVKQKYDSNVHSPTLRSVNNLYYAQDQEFQNGKMNFHQFLKSIEFIAQKTYPQQENNLTHLIQTNLLQLERQIKTEKQEFILQNLVDLLQDERIIQLFSIMQDVFDVYYQFYVQSNKTMDQNQFMKFCIDFELSNCLVSQARLMDIFYALASLNVTQQKQRNMATLFQKTVFIDKHQFVEAISLIGVTVYQNEPSKLNRIIFLLEKMNESQGAINTKKSFGLTRSPKGHHWDLVQTIQQFFHSSAQEQKKQSFDQILSQGLQELTDDI